MGKHRLLRGLALCLPLVAGCAAQIAWPSRTARYYAYHFTPYPSYDDAAENLRDLSDKILVRVGKKHVAHCEDLDIDNDGLHLTFKWIGREVVRGDSSATVFAPGGMALVNSYNNVYVPVGRQSTVTVPFKGIEMADLVGHGSSVHLYYDNDTTIVLGLGSPSSARVFLDSLLTMAQHDHLHLLPDPGFTLYGALSPELMQSLHLDHGLLIGSVHPGGPADLAGLTPGDVILDMNGQSVETIADYADAIKGGGSVTLHVKNFWRENDEGGLREGKEKTVTLTPVKG